MRKEILIVDDAKTIRLLLRMTLEAEGYGVQVAADAKEALLKPDGRRLDLILSDLNMPHMDGISFALEAKKRQSYLSTPIIMITTESGAKRKSEGQAAGLNAWITKPFNGAQKLIAVNQVMAA